MIIIPHEDDEINLAGSFIYSLTKSDNKDIYVVFLTNGDFRGKDIGLVRINEAVNSCKKLGVDEKKIIFLGYPDTAPGVENNIFSFEEGFSFNGISETYGNEKYPDYHYIKHGEHAAYGMKNMRGDLEELLLEYKPEFIFYNDNDYHPMHRVLSMTLDAVINKIFREDESYRPWVYKGLSYDLSWLAPEDYTVYNLKSSKTKQDVKTLSNPYVSLNDLIRFPVSSEIAKGMICDNPIFKASRCHKSQMSAYLVNRCINSDICFYRKRFDNIIGKTAHIVKDNVNLYNANTWYTNTPWIGKDAYIDYDVAAVNLGRKIEITVDTPIMGNIIIYNAIKSEVNEIKISTNTESYTVRKLNNVFSLKGIKINDIIKIESLNDEDLLFNEIELFEENVEDKKPWFIKLKINDEYAYTYYKGAEECEISAVVYNNMGEDITESEEVIIDNLGRGNIRAYLKHYPDITDDIEIKKLGILNKIKFKYLTFKSNYTFRRLWELDVNGRVSLRYKIKLFVKCLIGR